MYFEYGEEETAYLSGRDAALGEAIALVGHVYRDVDDDLFSSVVHHIIGQQISTRAQQTVWQRMLDSLGEIAPATLASADPDALQGLGMTHRKAGYIQKFARKVEDGEFDLEAVAQMDDADAIGALTSLDGVGVWTAEMILLFCLERPDVLSFRDLGIRRGMRMVYQVEEIDGGFFEERRQRLSPHGSVASLYFWAVSGGAVCGLRDPAKG